MRKVKNQMDKYEKLSQEHKKLIPDFVNHMDSVKECIEANTHFLSQILGNAKADIFEGDHVR